MNKARSIVPSVRSSSPVLRAISQASQSGISIAIFMVSLLSLRHGWPRDCGRTVRLVFRRPNRPGIDQLCFGSIQLLRDDVVKRQKAGLPRPPVPPGSSPFAVETHRCACVLHSLRRHLCESLACKDTTGTTVPVALLTQFTELWPCAMAPSAMVTLATVFFMTHHFSCFSPRLLEICVATVTRLRLWEDVTGPRFCLPALSNPRACAAKRMYEVKRIAATRSVLAQRGHDRAWPATYSCQSRHRRRQATVSSSLTPGCKPGPTLSL